MKNPFRTANPLLASCLLPACLPAAELVNLDATGLPDGRLSSWTNTGTLGGSFSQSSNFQRPPVEVVSNIRAVSFDGNNDSMVGPVAPSTLTGNSDRTVIAWVFNPSVGAEDTIISWGRRDGPDKTLSGFFHGNHDTWGAFGGWGLGDVGWSNQEKTGVWTCCSFVYDSASGLFKCYTDGQLSTTKNIGPIDTWATNSSGGALPIVLGAQNSSSGSIVYTNGSLSIARLRVYDTAFSESEVIGQFASEAADFGLNALGIVSFAASETTIYAGESTSLSWQVVGATSVSIDQGVSTAGGSPVTVSPTETTTYTMTVSDGSQQLTGTVTVNVLPGTPVAEDDSVIVAQNTATPVTLVATDPNTPQGSLVWEIVASPAHGTLSGTAPALTYTPANGFFGADSFTFRVSDGNTTSNVATVSIEVDAPPSPPTAVLLSENSISEAAPSGSYAGTLSATDANIGDSHTFALVAGGGDTDNGLFTISGNQLLVGGELDGLAGTTLSVRVRATDAGGLTHEQTLTLLVEEADETVVINEIHYDPEDNKPTEFVEIHNPTEYPIDISGWQFTSGIDYTFPASTVLAPGGFAVVAYNTAAFANQFGFAPFGPFDGKLSGDGEEVVLANAVGDTVDSLDYGSEFPWPIAAGGDGPSMELINPLLDNDLAGSWRSSGAAGDFPEITYIPANASGWRWRDGASEASSPTNFWRANGFSEDGTWTTYQSPIGYGLVSSEAGTLNFNTVISGMQDNYNCIFLRKTFDIPAGEVPTNLLLRYSKDDGVVIWINGQLVVQRNMNTDEPTIATFAATDNDTEGLWYEESITNAATLLVEGTNTVAVQVVNGTIGSSDLGFDMELLRPSGASTFQPTPGAANTVFSPTAPPQIRQVNHSPEQPSGGEPIVLTAKVTDPQGVGEVRALYQIVAPGDFIPARVPRTVSQVLADPYGERPVNPAFEDPANWTTIVMKDDGTDGDVTAGDSVFTAVIPGQIHRTLVRYRIEAEDIPGTSVRVPYEDDASLNFACFVYDGVPDYVASTASVTGGAGKIWPKEMLTTLPVYHWIIRNEDMMSLQAYNGSQQFPNTGDDNVLAARRSEEWEGAFVYDGKVYDHVVTRLRGGNSRYGDFDGRFPNGRRHYKFRFHRGNYFQAKDQYGNPFPAKWKRMAFNRMFGTKGGSNWGMTEEIGSTLWRTFGVPAAHTHWIHFRVIDGVAEAPDQYNGDFWGLSQVVEEYESGFLESNELEKGNLYKMSDWIWDSERQRRYQSPDMVSDGSEFNNIRDNLHGAQGAAWLQQYVNYDKWYRYSAVAEGIRHYDLFPYINEEVRHALKNLAWYFEPTGGDPTRGVCWFLPYDWDASFGPNFNNGWEHANNALYGWDMSTNSAPAGAAYIDKPAMKLEHRNVLREFRDLIWQPNQLNGLMDDRAAVISEFFKADMDRWRNAPVSSGTGNDDPLIAMPGFAFSKLQDMKNFSFSGWTGASGPPVGSGGRGAYLDAISSNGDTAFLPTTPTITYNGDPAHAVNGLAFTCSNFADPQGTGTFAAMEWRIGEIEDPTAPGWQVEDPFKMEYTPVWLSGELTSFSNAISIPAGATKPGFTYRARVRMKDNTGRWSHWSAAYEFTTTLPDDLAALQQNLMITEVMYNPAGPPPASLDEQDFEYLELQNISSTLTLDLTNVRFTKGIDFDFAGSAITSLAPGAYVLVVKSIAAFEERYGTGLPVAGEWEALQNLSNGGEQIKLSYGAGTAIHDFVYDDADPWPAAADGDGFAMVLVDPGSAPDHTLPTSWTAGLINGGTPGGPEEDPDAYATWQADAFDAGQLADPLVSGLSADPDGDGLVNLLEFALGTNPLSADAPGSVIRAIIVDAGATDHFGLEFPRLKAHPYLTYTVEVSDDLELWRSGALETLETSAVDLGNGFETATVRSLQTYGEPAKEFLRLNVLYTGP